MAALDNSEGNSWLHWMWNHCFLRTMWRTPWFLAICHSSSLPQTTDFKLRIPLNQNSYDHFATSNNLGILPKHVISMAPLAWQYIAATHFSHLVSGGWDELSGGNQDCLRFTKVDKAFPFAAGTLSICTPWLFGRNWLILFRYQRTVRRLTAWFRRWIQRRFTAWFRWRLTAWFRGWFTTWFRRWFRGWYEHDIYIHIMWYIIGRSLENILRSLLHLLVRSSLFSVQISSRQPSLHSNEYASFTFLNLIDFTMTI